MMIWHLAFFHTNLGYSGVTFSRIPWSVVLFLLGFLVGLGAEVGFTNSQYIWIHLGVEPKIWCTPKWLIDNGKPLLRWMIWGYPYFWKHPFDSCYDLFHC